MEDEQIKQMWVDEFAPQTIDEVVLSEELKSYFKKMIESRNLVNVLLAGQAGIGKTTLAKVICKELNAEVLFIPCGIEGNVATAQGKVKDFCDSLSIEGRPKIIVLDELDSASGTQDNSFQKVLRNLVEQAQSDCRFIGTCNYPEKVIGPLKSRIIIPPVVGGGELSFTQRDLFIRLKSILDAKKIKYTRESLGDFINNIFKVAYPDIRKIISSLQGCCAAGELVCKNISISNTDKESFFKDLIGKCKTEKLLDLRAFACRNKEKFSGNWQTAAEELFNWTMDNKVVTDPGLVIKLVDTIYQMNLVVNKEIQFQKLLALYSMALCNG